MSRDESIIADDASSTGNKEDDDDDDDDDGVDERFDGQPGDPEKLKAFNVSRFKSFVKTPNPHFGQVGQKWGLIYTFYIE